MKARIVARFIVLLIVGAVVWASGTALQAQDVKALVGDWNGAVTVAEMGADLEIVCHFELDESGNLTGTIDSPSQGAFGLALADIVVEGKKISFGIDDPGVPGDPLFEGTLDEAGTKISGDFSQGGAAGTFELTKE